MTKGIRYKNHYLNEVIFRLNFLEIPDLLGNDESVAEGFKKDICKEFPEFKFGFNNDINVTVDTKLGKSQSSIEKKDLTWIFYNESAKKKVELNPRFLVLQYNKGAYIGFKEFLEDVILILTTLVNNYGFFKVNFMGLRYINQIKEESITETNINEYINSALTGTNVFDLENGEELSQMLSRLDLIKDSYNLTFQYGFFNPRFPDPKFKKEFILDFDCKLINFDSIKSKEDIISEVKKMNKMIYNKFKESTTKKLEEFMEVIE